jgi:hypothetical protein
MHGLCLTFGKTITNSIYMKKLLLTAAALCCTLSVLAQPQLRKDNIDEVLKAMTLEEKATLCVGSGWGSMVADIRATATFKQAKAQSWPVHKVLLPKEPVKEITVK